MKCFSIIFYETVNFDQRLLTKSHKNIIKMKQYVINAFDATDENALSRRMAARPFHIETVKQLKANGNFLIGGAILNSSEQMIGSTMIVQFEDEASFQDWFNNDPYNTMGVWEKTEINLFRVATID